MADELRYEVSIEGQKVPLPAQLADDDQKIIAALVPYFPGIANGKIMRGEAIDGLVTITVIKQAGTKGAKGVASSDQIISGQEEQNRLTQRHRDHGENLFLEEPKIGDQKPDTRIGFDEGKGDSTHINIICVSDRLEGARANHIVAVSPVMVLIPPAEGECGVVLRKLQKAKSEKNPVVALMERLENESIKLQELPPHELIKMDGAIGKALKDGEKEADWMKDTARFLAEATPMSSPVVPEGF